MEIIKLFQEVIISDCLILIHILEQSFIHYLASSWQSSMCNPLLAWASRKSSFSTGDRWEKRSTGDTLNPIISSIIPSHICKFKFIWIIYEWLSLQMNKIINLVFYLFMNLFDICGGYINPNASRVLHISSKIWMIQTPFSLLLFQFWKL